MIWTIFECQQPLPYDKDWEWHTNHHQHLSCCCCCCCCCYCCTWWWWWSIDPDPHGGCILWQHPRFWTGPFSVTLMTLFQKWRDFLEMARLGFLRALFRCWHARFCVVHWVVPPSNLFRIVGFSLSVWYYDGNDAWISISLHCSHCTFITRTAGRKDFSLCGVLLEMLSEAPQE